MISQALSIVLLRRVLAMLFYPFQPEAGRLLTATLAFLFGMAGVLGFPPHSQPLVLVVCLGLLMALSWQRSWKRAFWHGFWFGLGHFLLGFSWLITSLNQFGHIPLPVSLAMLVLLAAAMALYPALFGALLPLTTPRVWWLPVIAPLLWSASEWLRSHLLTGFAWNLTGYSWSNWLTLVQIADLGGVYLLSWLSVTLAALLVIAMRRDGRREEVRRALGVAVILVALAHSYGQWRLETPPPLAPEAQNDAPERTPPVLRVGLVQGNIAQNLKWQPEYQESTMQTYSELSRSVAGKVDIVVWPETAIPMFLQASPHYIRHMGKLAAEIGAPILAGTPTAVRNGEKWRYHNSLLLLDTDGTLDRRYDKHHLVPFGEYIPLRRFIPSGFQKLTAGAEDFQPGPGPVPLPWGKGAIGALICYEADVPDEVRQLAMAGAKWLINATNDGWFGEDAKPQHLAMAKYRAVENRLPLVRAANTGISAGFDAHGRELGRLSANRKGVLRLDVPQGWGESPYHRLGDWWILLGTLLALILVQGVHWPSRGGRWLFPVILLAGALARLRPGTTVAPGPTPGSPDHR